MLLLSCSKVRFLLLILLLTLCSDIALYAQRVAADVDPIREYTVGLELFQKKKYAAAQERLDRIVVNGRCLPSIDQENAAYYQARCGLELFNRDGEYMMKGFIAAHPEHPKVNDAHFYLGKFYFTKKRYRSLLKQFALVDEEKLDEQYLEEFYFKKGYSHFQLEEYDMSKEALDHVLNGGAKYRSPAQYYTSYILYREGKNETALKGFVELEDDPLFGKVVPFYILQIYHRQGRSEEVLSYGTALLEKDFAQKKSGEIHRMLGEAYFNLEDYAGAVPELEMAISEMGGNRDDRYKLAYAAYRGGNLEKAVLYLEQVATEDDELSQLAHYHLGDCYLKMDKKMEARGAFRSASKFVFDTELQEDAMFNFAKLAYELSFDPYHEAVQAFEEYINKNPDSERVDEAYEFLLKVYLTTRNYEAALKSLDRIKDKNEELKATYQRVSYLRATELFRDLQFKRAIHFYKKSEKYPLDKYTAARSLFWQAESYARMHRWRAAEEHYKLFIEAPGAISIAEYGLAHYGIAYVYFDNEQHDNAILWFRKFADTEKVDLLRVNDATLRIADAYYLSKKNRKAIEYYDRAIKLDKFDTDYAIFQIAVCYGLEGQNGSKVETMKAMLENYPETDFAADAKYEIAETYFFGDNSEKAIEYFNKVIVDHPNSSYVRKAKLNKGLLFYNQSKDVDALPLFEEVADNYPATEEAKEALMKIQKIYVEKGDVPGFEQYVADKNFPDITKGALDTSYYESAEFMYVRGQLAECMKEFQNYLEKFPNGFFSLNANFYRAESALQLKLYDEAIEGYDHVLGFAKNVFTERALIAAAQIYFYQKNYNEALLRYTMLEEVAEVADNLIESRIGLMRSYYLHNNFEQAHAYATRLHRSDKVPELVLNEASLISAKCALAQNDLKMAEARFKETLLNANNEIGAEAMYNVAYIHYLNEQHEESQDLIFEMVNIFPNYGDWISKSFLLLADNYMKQDDLFQARLTLQNLIDNYDGALKEEAILKLKFVNDMEPKLEERKEEVDLEVKYEQEAPVREDIFEEEIDEEDEYELELNEQ